LRLPILVGSRDEEHVSRLDERAIAGVDAVVNDSFLDPIGKPPRVETILKLPTGCAIETHALIFSGNPHDHQTFGIQDASSCETEGRCGERPFFYYRAVGYHLADASKLEWEDRPPGAEGQAPRRAADVTTAAELKQSRGRVWRYPVGTRGRRHADKAQEEVFVVISGALTMLLGDPPERIDVGPESVVAVEPGTPLQVRNEGGEELVLYIYGAPPDQEGADFFDDPGDL
jgi:mannose-6-phosphate isomerase-like protein (cupin superfamily)